MMKHIVKNLASSWSWLNIGIILAGLLSAGCGLTRDAREARFLESGKKHMAANDYTRAALDFQNAIRLKKDDAEPYYQLARAYLAMGNYKIGIPILNKALEVNPNHVQAQIKLAELRGYAVGEEIHRAAEAGARRALTADPNNTDALNALAIAEWKLGEHRDAERDFMRAISQSPQNLRAAMNLAAVKVNQKDIPGAEQVIKTAAAANPKSPEPAIALGGLYILAGKTDAAEQQYRRAVQIDPLSDRALLSLGGLYSSMNRREEAEKVYKQISALPGSKYKTVHASFLFQSGQREQAVTEFAKLYKDNSFDRAIRTQLVEAYFSVGKLSEAENILTAVLKVNGKDTEALLQRSRLYLTAGNYAESEKDVNQVLRFEPTSAPAHYVMAELDQKKGQTLRQREQLTETLRLNRYLLPARLQLAQLLQSANQAATALQVLDETPLGQKTQVPVLVQRNWALWASGDFAGVRKGINEGLHISRTSDFLLQDALLKLHDGKWPEAESALEEALKLNPGDVRALAVLSRGYMEKKQASVALQKAKEYAAHQPNSAPVQHFLGNLLLANSDRRQARVALDAAVASDPKFIPAQLALAQLDVAENKPNDAEQRLNQVLKVNPANTTARTWLGNIQVMKGDNDRALKYFREVVESDAVNAMALNNLAYLLAEYQKKPDEALKYAEHALELAPDNPEYADTLGWILYRKALYGSAVKQLERAATRDENAVTQYHLAMAYAKAGDSKRARATFELAQKRDPNVREAGIARDVLSQGK